MIKFFQNFALFWVNNANFLIKFLGENIFKNHNIGPRLCEFSPIGRVFTLGSFLITQLAQILRYIFQL
jgi:hypothetical protein